MKINMLVDRLACFGAASSSMLAWMPPDVARWKPTPDDWSVLEIVNHLADEEHEDFRARLRSTLEDPSRPWTPIDPAKAARDRAYNERDLDESLERFMRERAVSVAWLRSLEAPDWDRAHAHASLGVLRAGDLLAAWCAHDTLHLRQIARRLFQLTARDAAPYDTGYAGVW